MTKKMSKKTRILPAENTLKFEIIAEKFSQNLSKKDKSGSHNPIFEITKINIAALTATRIISEIILRIFYFSKLIRLLLDFPIGFCQTTMQF